MSYPRPRINAASVPEAFQGSKASKGNGALGPLEVTGCHCENPGYVNARSVEQGEPC